MARGTGSAGTSVLRNQFPAGLEYQIELQKFLVLVQNPNLAQQIITGCHWEIFILQHECV